MNSPKTSTRRRVPPAAQGLAKVLLLFGLLLMHVVGGDHTLATPSAPHLEAQATAHQHTASSAAGTHAQLSPAGTEDNGVWCADDGCGMEMSVAGLCIVALLGGGILLHRAGRHRVHMPGRGLPAPPLWQPVPAVPTAPSLVQLSVSRT